VRIWLPDVDRQNPSQLDRLTLLSVKPDGARVLGRGDFVESVLKSARENFERKHVIRARGYDFEWLLNRVADMCGLPPKELVAGGKQRQRVMARSLICYWGTKEFGMSALEISKNLNIAPSTASECVTRGWKIVEEKGLKLLDEGIE
jgi:putative transposase